MCIRLPLCHQCLEPKDKARGRLQGVSLVASDAHGGLVKAIEEAFPGACWQECQTHFMRRALDLVRDLDTKEVYEDLRQLLEASSQDRACEAEARLRLRWEAILAVLNIPPSHRKRLRTTNHVGGSGSANVVSRSGALRRDSWRDEPGIKAPRPDHPHLAERCGAGPGVWRLAHGTE